MNAEYDKLCTVDELVKNTNGELIQGHGSTQARVLTTDSRIPLSDSLFVALLGKKYDGARFCDQAVKGGSRILMVNRDAWQQGICGYQPPHIAVVAVADTLRALGDIAGWHCSRNHARVIGITGSNGKTTTKEMTANVLGNSTRVLASFGNFNNLVGLPLSVLGLKRCHAYAVLEMGMSARGEIARMCEIASPQVGVITNIHPVHLEGLGNIQQVAEAKCELLEALPPNGVAICNADDPYVLKLAERTRARRVMFGYSPAAHVRVSDVTQTLEGLRFFLHFDGRTTPVKLKGIGLPDALNAAGAAAVGLVEEVSIDQIAERLSHVSSIPLRMECLDLDRAHLLIDCYNANPRSVHAALTTLTGLARKGEKFAVLGDMFELGDDSDELHRQIGLAAARAHLHGVCAFGCHARYLADSAREAGVKQVYQTELLTDVVSWLGPKLRSPAWVLIKGSRAMHMERIVSALAREYGVLWPKT